jgi:putative nucleotidyltransferase with HDIG domain
MKPPHKAPRGDLKYGQGQHQIRVSRYELAEPEELKIKLLSIFQNADYKPPVLPDVALELTELTRHPDVSYAQVTQVLERDPLVLAQVLKVAQSPVFATKTPVQSVAEALNRLGIAALRDVVWQVVADMRLFRARAYQPVMKRLRAHSLFTAHMVRQLAREARIASDHAFLCGLLHDVGLTGTLIALSEGTEHPPPIGTLWPALDKVHTEAGHMMAQLWKLSPDVCEVIKAHHQLPNQGHFTDAVVALISLAEALGNEIGWGVVSRDDPSVGNDPPDVNPRERLMQSATRLKLDQKMDVLRTHAEKVSTRLGGPIA